MVGVEANLSDAELAELAAFADGSLPPSRRAQVAARVERSLELRALVDEQRAALAAARGLEMPAPAYLHAQHRHEPRSPQRRRCLAPAGGLAAALAVAALLAVLLIPGPDAGPTLGEVAAVADRAATAPAPPPRRAAPTLLSASVAGVPFPDYTDKFGFAAAGMRADDLDGRATQTVIYEGGGRRIAYTIVPGDALGWPAGAKPTIRDGTELRYLERGAATLVTWLRDGRTCVLSSVDLSRGELLELAAWKGKGSIPF